LTARQSFDTLASLNQRGTKMKRPAFPKAPANVKIPAHSMRYLATWFARMSEEGYNQYAAMPCLTIRPLGYWGDTITVRHVEGVAYKISYSSGGTDGSISNFETIDNFISGLQYAKEVAVWLSKVHVMMLENCTSPSAMRLREKNEAKHYHGS